MYGLRWFATLQATLHAILFTDSTLVSNNVCVWAVVDGLDGWAAADCATQTDFNAIDVFNSILNLMAMDYQARRTTLCGSNDFGRLRNKTRANLAGETLERQEGIYY